MSLFLLLLASCGQVSEKTSESSLRYLRSARDGFTPESVVTSSTSADTRMYDSVTVRPGARMKLTLRFDKGHAVSADAVLETAQSKTTAALKIANGVGRLQRGAKIDILDNVRGDVIITTAPDWSDILQLVQRYDRAKGGKQEFMGLWIHPVEKTLRLTFSVECIGQDTLRVKDRVLPLDRYRIRLRSGDYLVWADAAQRVIKLVPAGSPQTIVVLEGFESVSDALRP